MYNIPTIFDNLIKFLFSIIIIFLQIIAPISMLIFLFISFFSPSYTVNLIFFILFISYILGLFTSNLAKSFNTSRAFRSHFENHHPLLSVFLNILITFFFPFLLTLVFCLIAGNFDFYFQQVLLTYFGWRFINAIRK